MNEFLKFSIKRWEVGIREEIDPYLSTRKQIRKSSEPKKMGEGGVSREDIHALKSKNPQNQ